jgi:6-phosphogluconate dehydrogenase
MQLGMIGLGRMGANMVRRLLAAGHDCVVYDRSAAAVDSLEQIGATAAGSFADLAARLQAPRVVWLMVPAAAVDAVVADIEGHLEPGDILVDGGNSHYVDDVRRARELSAQNIRYVDVGTSGGIRGLERGYCMMIGGDADAVGHLDPIFEALAPGKAAASPTPGRSGSSGTAERGYLHCGASGSGHFVKMVHNGIEYGLMAAYAEGFNLLRAANAGAATQQADAETAPLANPEHYTYDLPIADVAEVWRRGSVISSWLLDLIADALVRDPELRDFAGRVADSGEGRWTINAAIDAGVPVPVLATALFGRYASRGGADFQNQLLSAMRRGFGGHEEKGKTE